MRHNYMSEDALQKQLDSLDKRLERIEDVIEEIRKWQLAQSIVRCPSPGACIPLQTTVSDVTRRLQKTEDEITNITAFNSKLIGAFIIVTPIISFLSQLLLKKFGV